MTSITLGAHQFGLMEGAFGERLFEMLSIIAGSHEARLLDGMFRREDLEAALEAHPTLSQEYSFHRDALIHDPGRAVFTAGAHFGYGQEILASETYRGRIIDLFVSNALPSLEEYAFAGLPGVGISKVPRIGELLLDDALKAQDALQEQMPVLMRDEPSKSLFSRDIMVRNVMRNLERYASERFLAYLSPTGTGC